MKEEKDQSVERKPVVEITYDTPYELLPETGNPRYPTKRVIECERCGKLFVPRSPRTRFCDDCRVIHEREKARERWIKNGKKQTSAKNWKTINGKKVYVPSGYNQAGENNSNYKNGSGIDWFKKALEVLPAVCNRCGKTEEQLKEETGSSIRCLLLHHKDGVHENNTPDNWEILCKRCHQEHHSVRGEDGRFVSNKG